MKSCRNCAHSTHDGWMHRPNLICKLAVGTPVAVVAEVSMSIEENQATDRRAQSRAQMCQSYTHEENTNA